MRRQVLHLSWVKPGPFGSTRYTTWCNRMTTGSDGMSVADTSEKVTCKFCLSKMKTHGLPKSEPDAGKVSDSAKEGP